MQSRSDLSTLYKGILLDHARRPRGRGRPDNPSVVRQGRNALCGDALDIALVLAHGKLAQVGFEGHACAVCTASASMMTETVKGLPPAAAADLCRRLGEWLSGAKQTDDFSEPIRALAAVRSHPARIRCALLPWETLHEALLAAGGASRPSVDA